MMAAGGMIGVSIAAAGAAVGFALPGLPAPLAVVLGAAAFAYALHELEFLRLPVPGRDWQVPADWVRLGYYRSAAVFGGIVGFGVFTRVPFAILPVLLAWIFVAGDPLYGALAGLAYGATRAISIYSAASASDAEELVGLTHSIMALASSLHRATGLLLAVFAAYLLAAPHLS